MAAIDIRDDDQTQVDRIVFSEPNIYSEYLNAYACEKQGKYVRLLDNTTPMYVHRSDVQNLIKALQKAVELGWTNE